MKPALIQQLKFNKIGFAQGIRRRDKKDLKIYSSFQKEVFNRINLFWC